MHRWLRPELAASYLPLDRVGFEIVERVIDRLPLVTRLRALFRRVSASSGRSPIGFAAAVLPSGWVPVPAVGGAVMPTLHSSEAGPQPAVVPGGEVVAAGLFAEFVVDDGDRPGVVQTSEVFHVAGVRGPARRDPVVAQQGVAGVQPVDPVDRIVSVPEGGAVGPPPRWDVLLPFLRQQLRQLGFQVRDRGGEGVQGDGALGAVEAGGDFLESVPHQRDPVLADRRWLGRLARVIAAVCAVGAVGPGGEGDDEHGGGVAVDDQGLAVGDEPDFLGPQRGPFGDRDVAAGGGVGGVQGGGDLGDVGVADEGGEPVQRLLVLQPAQDQGAVEVGEDLPAVVLAPAGVDLRDRLVRRGNTPPSKRTRRVRQSMRGSPISWSGGSGN